MLHADVMMEPGTGRSKGCGLVVFASAADAESAISQLHDTEIHGRKIFVREDREAALPGLPAPGGRGVSSPAGGAAPAPSTSTPRCFHSKVNQPHCAQFACKCVVHVACFNLHSA